VEKAQDNHPEELFSNKFFDQKLEYIHMNPVKEGWVEFPEHFLYSSVKDYCGQKGMIEIKYLD
jgi:putative transposase